MTDENSDFTSEPDVSTDAEGSHEAQADQDQPERPPADAPVEGRSNRWWWLLAGGVFLGVVMVGMVLFALLNPLGKTKPSPTPTRTMVPPTSTPTSTPSPTNTPTTTPSPTPDVVLMGVKALGELNTVQYSLKTVIEKEAQLIGEIDIGPVTVEGPQLHFLLVAGGRVKAGVDFREIVRYEIVDDKVTVFLPAPRITDYYVDMQSLKLYYVRTDFGVSERFAIEVYNEAIMEAQESLRSAALESDILDAAQTNAAALVQSLILGLGFSEVEVEFLPPRGNETLELNEPLELIPTLAPFLTATPEGT